MRIIGLTGSIACGKSTVSSYLLSRGYPVVDGDRISRDLTAPGSPALQQIHQVFGANVFYEDGSLNRRRLGRLIFSDPEARRQLDQLMAPFILSATQQQIESSRVSGAKLCFLDMPLLFEKGYDRLCSAVWTVWLPLDLQLSRLMVRDGFSREEAMNRIRSVLSSDEKAARSTHVIDNSGTIDQTCRTVDALLAEALNTAELSVRPRRVRNYDSAGPASAPETPAVSVRMPPPAPETTMTRPETARNRREPRKAAWRMPVWLKTALISAVVLLAAVVTALILMNAYLRTCEEKHIAEQQQIDRQYPLSYRSLIEQYASEYNLAPAYVTAIIRNESSFNAKAESGAGARGLMQLMPDTAEWIAHKLQLSGYAFERMLDPESNIRFGCWYLNYLSRLFRGDPVAVTAAYHAGQGQVKVWLSDPLLSEDGYTLTQSSLPEGPTKKYVGRVTRDYGIYQEKYFTPAELPADPDPAASGS